MRVREDGGDAGAGDPAAFGRLCFVAPHRHVTDRNPGTSVMAFCAPGASGRCERHARAGAAAGGRGRRHGREPSAVRSAGGARHPARVDGGAPAARRSGGHLGRGEPARRRGAGARGGDPRRARRSGRARGRGAGASRRCCPRRPLARARALPGRAVEDWERDGMLDDPGQDRVVAYIFPIARTCRPRPSAPQAVPARTGFYCFDTTTALGRGTRRAARAAVDCALTAADLAACRRAGGVRVLPSTRAPRDAHGVRWILLPEQRRSRRAAPTNARRACVMRRRRRRASGERNAAGLLRGRLRPHMLGARRSGGRLVPSLP